MLVKWALFTHENREIITPPFEKVKRFRLISAIFQEDFGILVVEKRHAISEHYFSDRNGQSGAQSENG